MVPESTEPVTTAELVTLMVTCSEAMLALTEKFKILESQVNELRGHWTGLQT